MLLSSPFKKSKKAKTSSRTQQLSENDFEVRVRLPTLLTANKGKSDKSPKTPSTSTANKGKKIKVNSPTTIVKKKQNEVINAKSTLQNGNLQFWQERGMKLKYFEDNRLGAYLWQWKMKELVAQPRRANATMI